MTQPITQSYRYDEQTSINDTTNHSVVSLWRTDTHQWHNQSLCRIVMTNRRKSMTQPITLSYRYDEQTSINDTANHSVASLWRTDTHQWHLVISSKHVARKISTPTLQVGSQQIVPSTMTRNIGVVVDAHMLQWRPESHPFAGPPTYTSATSADWGDTWGH